MAQRVCRTQGREPWGVSGFCREINRVHGELYMCIRPSPDWMRPTRTGRRSTLPGPLLRDTQKEVWPDTWVLCAPSGGACIDHHKDKQAASGGGCCRVGEAPGGCRSRVWGWRGRARFDGRGGRVAQLLIEERSYRKWAAMRCGIEGRLCEPKAQKGLSMPPALRLGPGLTLPACCGSGGGSTLGGL